MEDGKLYTVREVAAALQIHPETIRRWLREGKLKGVVLGGGGYRVEASEIERIRREGVER